MNKIREEKKPDGNNKRVQAVARSVGDVFGGKFLTREKVTRQLPLLILIVVLAMLYIANSYSAERLVIQINRVKKENEVLRYEHVLIKSELMHLSRKSEVAKKLNTSGIKESTVPPFRIYTNKKRK